MIPANITLYYNQPTGDPILENLVPVNFEALNLPEEYLMIFGKQGKHLVKLIGNQYSLGGTYFTYELNMDGYVTKRQTYDVAGGALTDKKGYEYVVTSLGLSL